MFSFIKQLFILLLSFISALARVAMISDRTKCLFLNDDPYMVRLTLIDMNPVVLKYYPFMISINKCTGSFNVLPPKMCVAKETKNIM